MGSEDKLTFCIVVDDFDDFPQKVFENTFINFIEDYNCRRRSEEFYERERNQQKFSESI